jgi:hypothetical protein
LSDGVPIWVSGTINPRVVGRLARFGTGWIPWGPDAADPPAAIPKMRAALSGAGRDPSDLQVLGHLTSRRQPDGTLDIPRTMAEVPALLAAGVTDVRITARIPQDKSAALDHLSTIAAHFRTAAAA